MRSRFEAVNDAPLTNSFVVAVAASIADVPALIGAVERLHTENHTLRLVLADLVAACRAGLLVAAEHGDPIGTDSAWEYVTDQLPPAPAGHPLHTLAMGGELGGGVE